MQAVRQQWRKPAFREHDELPHFIEGVKSLEKQNNAKLSLAMIKEQDGHFESTGNDTNATQILRDVMEDARGQHQVVQAASRSLWKTEEAVDKARWALKKARADERRVFSH